jgi:hypothetical protein
LRIEFEVKMQAPITQVATLATLSKYPATRMSYGCSVLLLCASAFGCSKAEKPVAQDAPAVTVAPKVNKKIEESLAKAAQRPASVDSDTAPPKDGVLSRERADKEAPLGAPPKLSIGAKGSEPFVVLGVQPSDKAPTAPFSSGKLELAVRTGPSAALPTVIFGLKHEPQKVDAAHAASARSSVQLLANEAKLSADQAAVIPEQLSRQIAALKGSSFSFSEEAGQTVGGVSFERAKGAPVEGNLLLNAAADALDAVLLAFPSEPIGKDGFYLSSVRTRFLNTDVVAYQLVKVLALVEQRVELEVTTRRYTVARQIGVPGLEGTQVVQFQSNDKAQLSFALQHRYPVAATLQQSTLAIVEAPQGKGPFQIDSHAKLTFAGK